MDDRADLPSRRRSVGGARARMSFLVTAPETDALPAVTSDKPQESGYHAPRRAEVE